MRRGYIYCMILDEAFWDAVRATFFTAMTPVLELRAAIPLGLAAGLPLPLVLLLSVVGNFLPVPVILLLIRRIFRWLRKFPHIKILVNRLEKRAAQKGEKVLKKYQTFGLVLLVAIPLPGTGAWTGALVADLFDIRMRTALPAILLGILIAAGLMTGVTLGLFQII